jgi:hopanoid biosynthesis associated protein HpnK
MASGNTARRLVVNADDFGRAHSINQAVLQAHEAGILTSASLMVTGGALDGAVEVAQAHPRLGVGLHLCLACGRAALKPTQIPNLVDDRYHFSDSAVWAGFRYFFNRELRWQLRHEIEAQLLKFRSTGLPLDHVDGHLNLHLHPTVVSLLEHHGPKWGVRHFRLTRDPFWLNARLAGGQWAYRIGHAIIFGLLCWRARPVLRRLGIRHTAAVFGLLQNGRVTEDYLIRLLPRLPLGDSELYAHPSRDKSPHELEALTSERVKELVREHNIQLVRYQDL